MSRISIALGTFNGEQFLSAQLESFICQTRPPDELVVCDDCSTDGTVRLVEEFARRAEFPVQLRRNETNLGSTKNFEQAIRLCTGDLIFLSDQDDVWLPEKLKRIETEFEKNPRVGMVFSDAFIVDEKLRTTGDNLWNFTFAEDKRRAARNGNFLDVLVSQNTVTGATMAFRADFRDSFMPIPDDLPNLIHDNWIALFIAAEADVAFVDEPLIKYRQHAGQQLGIVDGTRRTAIDNERRNRHAATIRFAENEIARLSQMQDIFAAYPQFESRRGTIEFENTIEKKRARIKHYEARRNLPSARWKRLAPVIREISSRHYHKFSRGWLSAASDLFEK